MKNAACEAENLLMDLFNQFALTEGSVGPWPMQDMGLSALEDAAFYLEKRGFLERHPKYTRCYRWKA